MANGYQGGPTIPIIWLNKMADFSRREVERAFRKFSDTVDDLSSSDFRTWADTLHHLLDHCENNPVMSVTLGPLKENKAVNFESWHAEACKTVRSAVGSGNYVLPLDDEDRTALIYQFLLAIDKNKNLRSDFCMNFYGSMRTQEGIYTFNQEIVHKFTREVKYKLQEILEDVQGKDRVATSDLIVYNHYDNSTVVNGGVSGGVVNIGPGTASGRDIAINTDSDLIDELEKLRSEFSTEAARNACDLLVKEIQGTVDRENVISASKTIIESEPTKGRKYIEILERIGTSVASSAIFHIAKATMGY